jgi:hypothetical protein
MRVVLWLTLANVILAVVHIWYLGFHLNVSLQLATAATIGEDAAIVPRTPPRKCSFPSSSIGTTSIGTIHNRTGCQGLAGSTVLFLNVHLEGNLGDEMETTPVLYDWHRCGVDVTVALSDWKPLPWKVHARTTREQEMVARMSSQNYSLYSPSDYDLIVLAPGPWKLCELQQRWPYPRVDVMLGGSFMSDSSCQEQQQQQSQEELLSSYYQTELVVAREPISYEFAQNHVNKNTKSSFQVLLGGDFSYSYRPALAALEYWQDYYQQRRLQGSIVIFSRSQNFAKGVRIKKNRDNEGYTILLKLVNGEKVQLDTSSATHQPSRIVVASSSDVEDASHFEWLHGAYPGLFNVDFAFEDRPVHLILCRSVEELWGLIGHASKVYTDRYHPGVAAHILNVEFDVLSYPAEQVKLNGLAQITKARNMTPAILQRANQRAFERVRGLLRDRTRRRDRTQALIHNNDQDQ